MNSSVLLYVLCLNFDFESKSDVASISSRFMKCQIFSLLELTIRLYNKLIEC